MGEKTITTQIKIDGEIVPDFSQDWEVEFQGEKYIMPLRIPQGAKENTSLNSTIDLTFQHWAIYQLKRWPFVTIQQIAAGTYLPDEEVAPVQLNLKDFCELFGHVLEYYYGGAITIDLNPAWEYKQEATIITISHTKIWNVLIDAFHDKYGVRWEIKAASDNSNTVKGGERYVIRVGYPTTEVDHIFEYGFEGGLLKVERQVQSEEIRNILKGRGGDTNIPRFYFKQVPDAEKEKYSYRDDPDWVEELANIPFTNLMGATFRSYVQGWKAAHISKYLGYTAVGESNAYAPWAYRKGYTDTKFQPVEFVADEITISPTTGDKQVEILPGYSPYVKKGSSLDKYGPLPDTLDNNDDIYPTLQGTGLDVAVAVEQIQSDDVAESTESDAQLNKIPNSSVSSTAVNVAPSSYATIKLPRVNFSVLPGKHGNLIVNVEVLSVIHNGKQIEILNNAEKQGSETINVYNAITGEKRSASGIPEGYYYFEVEVSVHNMTTDKTLNISAGTTTVKLQDATLTDDKWRNTFDIWVKNIWNSTKLSTETNEQYTERIWKPVLGDRDKNTAKVVFTSGALVHEDYEFTIVDFPVPDTSKTYEGQQSHWRITLAKSEAELEATGLYVPSTKKQGKAGDTFVFIGTEMTHVPYIVDAEERLDNWKKDQLGEVKEIKPTFVVTTDRVRLGNEGKADALISQLHAGSSIRLADKRFISGTYETLYLQSVTYTYREPTSDDAALNPDVEIVLGNEYTTSANPVSMMQGEISALQKQVGSISNIEQIVRDVGDKLYLRKDGISDRSLSPTQFFSLLTSGDFRAGLVGGAGWGFFKDENDNWVLEADRVNVRQDMSVNQLVINQAEGRGGMEIDTAAYIDGVTRVVETDNGYICYFDQKGGSVANLFHVDDVAFCNQWTAENNDLKFYKRRVTAVGADNITLSKTDVSGTDIPSEGDNIIHFGNYSDEERRYVKVRDIVGGGYERYIEELNSVNAEGVEYYFIGKQAGQSRWFVGHKDLVPYSGKGDGSFIEYKYHEFNLNNVVLSVGSRVGDTKLGDLIQGYDDSKYLREALNQSTKVINGLVLTSAVLLGYENQVGERVTMAGHSGLYSNPKSIASFWGGDMVDKFYDAGGVVRQSPLSSGFAASVMRMDGTGYFAKGNITWNADGSGSVAGGNLRWDAAGNIHLGAGVFVGNSTNNTLDSILQFINGINTLFVPMNGDTVLSWGDVAANEGLATALRAKIDFYSDKGVSSLGQNNATGGGGGSFGLMKVWPTTDPGSGTTDALGANLGWELRQDVLSLKSGSALSVVTAGSGNAITDIVKFGTTITATRGATFLTQHQSLANYYTKAEVNNKDYIKVIDCFRTTEWSDIRTTGSTLLTMRAFDVYGAEAGGPTVYGNVLEIVGRSGHWQPQLWFDSGKTGNVRHRNKTYSDNTWGDWYILLDTGNYSSYLDSRYYTESEINAMLTNGSVTKVGTTTVGAANRPIYLNAGTPTACTYSFGNGSGNAALNNGTRNTNLNADMLDGAHADDIRKSVLRFKSITGTSEIGGYDLNTLAPDGGCISNYGSYSYWANAPTGALYGMALHLVTQYNIGGQLFADVNHNSATDVTRNLWWRASGSVNSVKTWGKWHQIAFTDGNVVSATKLQFSRTLWGRPFDGTANVTGALTDVTSITMSGNINMAHSKLIDAADALEIHTDSGAAKKVCTGGLLVSDNYSDRDKIPSFGAYIKGNAKVGSLTIGDVTITYDAVNGGLHIIGGGLYSDSYISALGLNSAGSSGGGGSAFGLMRNWPATDPGVSTTDALGANLGWGLRQDVSALIGRVSALENGSALTVTTTGSGNAITAISKSGTTITATKGATFLTYTPLNGGLIPSSATTWGNSTGTQVAEWTDSAGKCAFKFKKDNPSSGKMSMLIDGTVYINEGADAVASQAWVNGRGYLTAITKAQVEAVLTGNITTHTHSQYLTSHQALDHINSLDTRDVATTPGTYGESLRVNFKKNATNSLNDGGTYNIELWVKGYGSATDFSGGYPHLLGFTSNGNIWHRVGTSATAWGAWRKLLDSDNTKISSGVITINGTSITPLTAHQSLANYVTLNTAQTITASKIFNAGVQAIWAFIQTGDSTLKIYSGKISESKSDGNICLQTSIDRTDGQTHEFPTQYQSRCNLVLQPRGGQVYVGTNPDGGNSAYKLYVNGNIFASSFVKSGGTSAQFLKADGSVDSNSYLTTGTASSTYVKKAGDTMTGALAVPKLYINGGGSTAFFSADNSYSAYINIGGKVLGFWSANEMTFRPSGIYNGQISLGQSSARWSTVYANSLNVASDAMVTNLNADMLDGVHASELARGGTAFYTANDGTGPRWIRIATFSSDVSSGIITIENRYNSNPNAALIFTFSAGYRGNNRYSLTQIGGTNALFSKARIVYPTATNEAGFIELYYDETVSGHNQLFVKLTNAINTTLIQTATTGAIPTTHAAYEQSFVDNGIAANNIAAKSITCDGWIHTKEGAGWINDTYGGGWSMVDSTWLRVWGGKSIYQDSGIMRTDGQLQVGNGGERFLVDLAGNATVKSTLTVGGNITTTADLYAGYGELDDAEVKYGLKVGMALTVGSATLTWDLANTALKCNQDFYSTKGVSALGVGSTSDMRLKNYVRPLKLSVADIAQAPIFIHTWKNTTEYAPGEWVGTSAQYWLGVLPQAVKLRQWYEMDYAKAAMASVIVVARQTEDLKSRVERLERENKELRQLSKAS